MKDRKYLQNEQLVLENHSAPTESKSGVYHLELFAIAAH